jgi:hypothetical protein
MLHWPTGHRVRLSAGHSLHAGKAAVLDNEGRYGMTWREEEQPQGQQWGGRGQGDRPQCGTTRLPAADTLATPSTGERSVTSKFDRDWVRRSLRLLVVT